jgi:hypothetical protein
MPLYLSQLRRSVGVAPSAFLAVVARPVSAALIMAAAVRWMLPEWSPAMGWAESVAWMVAGVALGVFAYVLAASLLWLGAGRPPGAERVVLDRLRDVLARRGAASASTH